MLMVVFFPVCSHYLKMAQATFQSYCLMLMMQRLIGPFLFGC